MTEERPVGLFAVFQLLVWNTVKRPTKRPVFFCRYGNVPFTKNPEKYIKYQVDQVGEMIEKLFDTSA